MKISFNFVDNNVSNATLENGYVESSEGVRISNGMAAPITMVNDREYSFIAMRGFAQLVIHPKQHHYGSTVFGNK